MTARSCTRAAKTRCEPILAPHRMPDNIINNYNFSQFVRDVCFSRVFRYVHVTMRHDGNRWMRIVSTPATVSGDVADQCRRVFESLHFLSCTFSQPRHRRDERRSWHESEGADAGSGDERVGLRARLVTCSSSVSITQNLILSRHSGFVVNSCVQRGADQRGDVRAPLPNPGAAAHHRVPARQWMADLQIARGSADRGSKTAPAMRRPPALAGSLARPKFKPNFPATLPHCIAK
jgi:hypothetical protein